MVWNAHIITWKTILFCFYSFYLTHMLVLGRHNLNRRSWCVMRYILHVYACIYLFLNTSFLNTKEVLLCQAYLFLLAKTIGLFPYKLEGVNILFPPPTPHTLLLDDWIRFLVQYFLFPQILGGKNIRHKNIVLVLQNFLVVFWLKSTYR